MTCGKKLLIVLAAALAVAAPAYAITGGSPDGGGHPAVGLLLADAGPAGFQPDCSGALIAPDVFVTAAHCFIGTASNRVLVTFDTQASASSKFVQGVAFPDPAFNADKKDLHDLAVVKLAAPVAGVTPLSLPKAGVVDSPALKSAQLTNVGYGYFDRSFVFDGIRRVSLSDVTNAKPTELRLAERPGGVCFGDSGGPRLLGSTILAVTSTGNKNCTGQSLSYRLDSASARAFLSQFVAVP
jgi:secreted trypsin-like serine protease